MEAKYIIAGILILAGYTLRVVAAMTLKEKFSIYLLCQDSIVKTGVYSKIRHPSYTGSIVLFCGIAILSIHAAFFYLVMMFYLQRASLEETILSANPDYAEYTRKTKRFVPWLF
jgi:protein-S-isoprenylcysteine O-methyltransferase Ste14